MKNPQTLDTLKEQFEIYFPIKNQKPD